MNNSENAGKQREDGLLIASVGKGHKLPIDLDEDDVDFSERNTKKNRDYVYAKNRVRPSRRQNIGVPNFTGMLTTKKTKNNYDTFGLIGLGNELMSENNELRSTVEKLPDSSTVKPKVS